MRAAELLHRVESAGAHLTPDGDNLKVSAPEPLPDELMAELKAAKPKLLELLTHGRCPECEDRIQSGSYDALCRNCPAWDRLFADVPDPEPVPDPQPGETIYQRPPEGKECDRCKRLKAQGVAVLACSECDVSVDGGRDG